MDPESPFFPIPPYISAVLRGEQPRPLHAADGGDSCYAPDAGRAIGLLTTAPTLRHDTYNVSSGRPFTNRDFADALQATTPGLRLDLLPKPWPKSGLTSLSTHVGCAYTPAGRAIIGDGAGMTSVNSSQHLTDAEADLLRAYRHGKLLDLTHEPLPDIFGLAYPDHSRKIIHAKMIKRLLLAETPVAPGSLRQLSISGAIITGPLNLQFAQISYPIRFTGCFFDRPVKLSEAHLRSVSLRDCIMPELDARHVTIDGDLTLNGVHVWGPLRLAGAHLQDDLHLDGAYLSSRDAKAVLDLDNIDVKGKIDANEMTVLGAVTMEGARVAGTLRMKKTSVGATAPAGTGTDPAQEASTAWIGDGMIVQGEVDATGLRATGTVRLIAAQVLDLMLRDVSVQSTSTALRLDRLNAHGMVCCDGDSHIVGGIRAVGIHVGSTMSLRGATMQAAPHSGESAAVNLRHAQITEDLLCTPSFCTAGRLDLTGARISGTLDLNGASLQPAAWDGHNSALIADNAEVTGDMRCSGFITDGVISLVNATVGGKLIMRQKEDGKRHHSALDASGVSVTNAVVDTAGTVKLGSADIAGDLELHLDRLEAASDGAAADLALVKTGVLTLEGSPRLGHVDLTGARARLLRDNLQGVPIDTPVVLDGFEYDEIAGLGEVPKQNQEDGQPANLQVRNRSLRTELFDRLIWLEKGTQSVRNADDTYIEVGFVPQPYQQLAAVYQHAGQDHDARRVLRTMYQRRNSVKTTKWFSKLWNHLQDWTIGYGYAPGQALVWLIALALGATIFFEFATRGGVARAFLLPLALVLPGSGYERLAPWDVHLSVWSHVIAGVLVFSGLVLGATVLAALARFVKR